MNYSQSDQIFLYNNKISASLHFFILNENNAKEQLPRILDFISKSLFYLSKTKCFLVYYRYSNALSPIGKLLYEAYLHQFCDFQVLSLSQRWNPCFFYIDYSIFHINWECNVNLNTSLDYYKFKKFKGYILRVGVTERWPDVYKNNYGRSPSTNPNIKLYKYYEYFAESFNISAEFIPINDVMKRAQQLRRYNLGIFLSADATMGLFNYNNILVIDYSKFLVIAPIIHAKRIKFSKTLILSMSIFFGLIILVWTQVKFSC